MNWFYLAMLILVIAAGMGILYYMAEGDWQGFVEGFVGTLIFELFLTLVFWLVYMALRGIE